MKIIVPYQIQIQRVLLTSALSFGLVLSAYSLSHAQVRQATNDQQISYQTGGLGQEELEQLRQHEANYNTQFSFANAADRAYLNNLQVRVTDAEQQLIFEDNEVGPLLYLQLAPGTYELKASSKGVEKAVTFSLKEGSNYRDVLTW